MRREKSSFPRLPQRLGCSKKRSSTQRFHLSTAPYHRELRCLLLLLRIRTSFCLRFEQSGPIVRHFRARSWGLICSWRTSATKGHHTTTRERSDTTRHTTRRHHHHFTITITSSGSGTSAAAAQQPRTAEPLLQSASTSNSLNTQYTRMKDDLFFILHSSFRIK